MGIQRFVRGGPRGSMLPRRESENASGVFSGGCRAGLILPEIVLVSIYNYLIQSAPAIVYRPREGVFPISTK